MRIGAIQKTSLIDYPGKISAIIFTQGCNFQCPYCHNPELVNPSLFSEPIKEEKVLSFLKTRTGKLDAVEITGGEPTLQGDLTSFIRKIKQLGFLVKLDTNGSRPDVIKKLLKENLIDYIAMDVKAPLEKYAHITKTNPNTNHIKQSIQLIKNSNIQYEFRTTLIKKLTPPEDILQIGEQIKGARLYVLQKFTPTKTLNPNYLKEQTYTDQELQIIKTRLEEKVEKCEIR